MKKINKSLYDACEYAQTSNKSLTKIAKMFNVDRHSISRHLNDYQKYNFLYEDNYYYISDEEQEPVIYFISNPELSATEVAQKYHMKMDTIKRRMKVMGLKYKPRTGREYNRAAFHSLETLEQAYWLGFILADGYINEDRNFLKIKLQASDEEHLKKFAIFMKEKDIDKIIKYDTGGAYTRNNKCAYIEFDSKELINDLKQYNLHQGKSKLEEPIEMPTEEMTLAYIRGMIDGDGHVKDGYFKYVGSLASCEYMKNIFSKWIDYKPECKYIYPHGTIYSFELGNSQVNKALKEIYPKNQIALNRKYEVVQNIK